MTATAPWHQRQQRWRCGGQQRHQRLCRQLSHGHQWGGGGAVPHQWYKCSRGQRRQLLLHGGQGGGRPRDQGGGGGGIWGGGECIAVTAPSSCRAAPGLQPAQEDEDRVEAGVHRCGAAGAIASSSVQRGCGLLQLLEQEAVEGREALEELAAWTGGERVCEDMM